MVHSRFPWASPASPCSWTKTSSPRKRKSWLSVLVAINLEATDPLPLPNPLPLPIRSLRGLQKHLLRTHQRAQPMNTILKVFKSIQWKRVRALCLTTWFLSNPIAQKTQIFKACISCTCFNDAYQKDFCGSCSSTVRTRKQGPLSNFQCQ